MKQPDFIKKPLRNMTHEEWESLCDGCGLCCQISVEDEDSGERALSNISCRFLCLSSHHCTDYQHRLHNVPDCSSITPDTIHDLDWLPYSCAYRLVAQGHNLPAWHHLICNDPEEVHRSGVSMKGELVSEEEADWSP